MYMSDLLRKCCCGCTSGKLNVCLIQTSTAAASSAEPGGATLRDNDPRGVAFGNPDQTYSGGGLYSLLQPFDGSNGGNGSLGEIDIIRYNVSTDNVQDPETNLKKIKDSCIIILGWGMGLPSTGWESNSQSEREKLFSFPRNIPSDTTNLPSADTHPYLNAIATAVIKNGALLVVVGKETAEGIIYSVNSCDFPSAAGNMQDSTVQDWMTSFLYYIKELSKDYGSYDSGYSAIAPIAETVSPYISGNTDNYGRDWMIDLNSFNTADLAPPACNCTCDFFSPPNCWGTTTFPEFYGAFKTRGDIIEKQVIDGIEEEQPYWTVDMGCGLSGGCNLNSDYGGSPVTDSIKIDKVGKGYLMVCGSSSSLWGPLTGSTREVGAVTALSCIPFCCDTYTPSAPEYCCPDPDKTFWDRGLGDSGWASRIYSNNVWFIRFVEQYLRTGAELPSP